MITKLKTGTETFTKDIKIRLKTDGDHKRKEETISKTGAGHFANKN